MNVGLPGGGNPASASTAVFWVIIATSIALIGGLLSFFRYKRWL
jgi:Mg2+ and Co2+ transporter CorA